MKFVNKKIIIFSAIYIPIALFSAVLYVGHVNNIGGSVLSGKYENGHYLVRDAVSNYIEVDSNTWTVSWILTVLVITMNIIMLLLFLYLCIVFSMFIAKHNSFGSNTEVKLK